MRTKVPGVEASHRRRRHPAAGRADRGFSLLEMLITMALILIMFVMLYGHGSGSYQRQQKLACQKNLQAIHTALEIYANDHDGSFPVLPDAKTSEPALSLLVPRYTSATAPFICPGSKEGRLPEGEPFAERRISYAYYMGRRLSDRAEVLLSDAQINDLPKLKGQQVFSRDGKKPGSNHHKFGGNFLFGDGHAEISPPLAPFSLVLTQGVVLLNPKP